jgi:cytochrome c5
MSRNAFAIKIMNNREIILLAAFCALLSPLNFAYAGTSELYNQACATCHSAGVLGAPKAGDKVLWAARMKAEGLPTMVKHVKEGYKNMPARGLCNTCTDADFKNLIEYMATK